MDYHPQANTKPESHYEYEMPLDKKTIDDDRWQALEMMDQLEGWCSKEKGGILFDLVIKNKPRVIVEIGVFGGKSVIPMAVALRTNGRGILYGIDPWESQESVMWIQEEANKKWWGSLDHKMILNGLIEKISLFGLEDQIVLIKSTSEKAPLIPNIDLLHIDGNHSEETSYFDVTKWVPLVKKGGWIIFDDMDWTEKGTPTTARAVDWLNAHCIKFAEFPKPCLWGIWVKQ